VSFVVNSFFIFYPPAGHYFQNSFLFYHEVHEDHEV